MTRLSDSLTKSLDKTKIPVHVAVIMDGNGRWASKRLLPRSMGHRAGMNALKEVVNISGHIGVQHLTVFAFSTENWKRPTEEVSYLMSLLAEFMQKEIDELHDRDIRINILGDYKSLPLDCVNIIEKSLAKTADNKAMNLNIALNYGARLEILKTIQTIAGKVLNGELSIDEIDEECVSKLLFTKDLPDPDLIIRTAGEMRLSNFLLWQIAYSEIWVSESLWPDFKKEDFLQAIFDYQKRIRKFGDVNEKK
ncbi:MAG: isoprenyl transferase [Syntrophomonadaceae bacterium]|jgi:undecaprenyl diphosphate synthase|nr:isoprenyl transferase [Syntrophomonadaceae bacterium]